MIDSLKPSFLGLGCHMTSHDWAKKWTFLTFKLPSGKPIIKINWNGLFNDNLQMDNKI
jgi:hypothetical protein